MDDQKSEPFIWTPIKLTDKATGRSVHITIFESELYSSGFFTFEDFWQMEHSSNNQDQVKDRSDDYVQN